MASSFKIQGRPIEERDLDEVAVLLARGLSYRKEYFVQLFDRLRTHPTPPGFPKYGYVLANQASIVGAILLIFSEVKTSGSSLIRCHVTSWYVEPEFRPYAALFFWPMLKRSDVTYLNTSARPGSIATIQVQGFSKYSEGQFVTIPLLHFHSGLHHGVLRWANGQPPDAECDPAEQDILLAHQKYGNISFWCIEQGKAYPFVFQKRLFKGILPGAQLVYCREVGDVVRFVGPIGRAFISRGLFLLRMDSNGPVAGLTGLYINGMEPRYYKGPKPRVGDLAYTQTVMVPFVRRSELIKPLSWFHREMGLL